MPKPILIILVLLLALSGLVLVIYNQRKPVVPTSDIVSNINPNTTITSPLTIAGQVPPGWMFEGVFPIILLDNNRQEIARTQGKETVPGSWTSGQPINFTATLTFQTTASSGYLVFQNDNPSGLPENQKSFETPVNF